MNDDGHCSPGRDMTVVDSLPDRGITDGNDDLGVGGIDRLHSQDGVPSQETLHDRIVDEPDDGKICGDRSFSDDQSVASGAVNDE